MAARIRKGTKETGWPDVVRQLQHDKHGRQAA